MWPQQLTPSRATVHAAHTHQTPWSVQPAGSASGFSDEETLAHMRPSFPVSTGLARGRHSVLFKPA